MSIDATEAIREIQQPRTTHLLNRLIHGNEVGQVSPPQWMVSAYHEFRRHVTHPDYPCFFGTRAELSGHLYYTYCDQAECPVLPDSLRHFIKLKRQSEHFDTNMAVFMAPKVRERSHDYYQDRLWRLLNHLHIEDRETWPESTETEPDKANWEFTFGGEQFFVFSTSPSYQMRRSRNLGDCQILMIQPRSSFTVLSKNANGTAVRERVRERLRQWDNTGVHPDLGVYGDSANREWKQYFLPDDMQPVTGKCPFHFDDRGKKVNGSK